MLTFLFEQYGYYPKNLENNMFVINNWTFKLIEVEFDEKYIEEVDSYINLIRGNFLNKGPFIIKSRYNKKITIYDGKKYVLVSISNCNMSLKDLNKFHYIFKEESKNVDLKKLFSIWEERVSNVETEAINSLRIDSVYYKSNIEIAMFCLGMAQNAMQYLSEIIQDYEGTIDDVTIVHKRLINLESFDFFNPFNFVIDHPLRDLVSLYKNDFLHFNDLIDLLEYYKLDSKLASFFIARLLYPAEILDLLEENITQKSTGFRIQYNIEKELAKTKKIYIYLKENFGIRPINWLEV